MDPREIPGLEVDPPTYAPVPASLGRSSREQVRGAPASSHDLRERLVGLLRRDLWAAEGEDESAVDRIAGAAVREAGWEGQEPIAAAIDGIIDRIRLGDEELIAALADRYGL